MNTYEPEYREYAAGLARRNATPGPMDMQTWSDMCDDYAVDNGYADVENPRISKSGYYRATLVRLDGTRNHVWCQERSGRWYVKHS